MLIVTITREEPERREREVFRYETETLDIPALIRATLEADLGERRDREERVRYAKAVTAILESQYCNDCERSPLEVVRAAMTGKPLPVCSGHVRVTGSIE